MKKNRLVCFILFFLFLNNFVFTLVAYCIPNDICVDAREKKMTNTPFQSVVFMNDTENIEAIDISQQIYNNILKNDIDLFKLSDEGIKNINGWKSMSETELEYVKDCANQINKNCISVDDIIRTSAEYVAKNICYDYDYYYYGRKEYAEINHSPYDVLVNGSAVCLGYTTLFNAILQIQDIPCITIYSPNHAWSMVYNGFRWLLIDTTWMSNGVMVDGELSKSSRIDDEWFDYTIDEAHTLMSHTIDDADYAEFNNTIRSFPKNSLCLNYEIPKNIIRVEDYAFYGCSKTKLIFNGSFECVGQSAFYDCQKLDGIINLKEIKELGMYAFRGCKSIDGVYIGGNIDTIPYCAFYDCSSLRKVVVNRNLKIIDDFAFGKCSGLEAFYYNGSKVDFDKIQVEKNTQGWYIFDKVVTDFKPQITVELKNTSIKKCNVDYMGVPIGETIICTEYSNGKLITTNMKILKENTIFDDISHSTDEVKIFVWNNLKEINPCCEAKSALLE